MSKLLIIISLCLVSSCAAHKVVDIKSPCVSTKDGPCGPRKSINDWWLNPNANTQS